MTHITSDHDKAYVCVHVFHSSRPVLLVSRSGGDWSFLCGAGHEDTAENYRVVGRGHILDQDSTLSELADLAPHWEAERTSIGSAWVRRPAPADE